MDSAAHLSSVLIILSVLRSGFGRFFTRCHSNVSVATATCSQCSFLLPARPTVSHSLAVFSALFSFVWDSLVVQRAAV